MWIGVRVLDTTVSLNLVGILTLVFSLNQLILLKNNSYYLLTIYYVLYYFELFAVSHLNLITGTYFTHWEI